MNIADVLAQAKRMYIDTVPLIYYIEEHPDYSEQMKSIITSIDDGTVMAFSSVITLTELLTQPLKLGEHKVEQEYRDILVNNNTYRLIPVSLQIADTAAKLRATYNLRTPDAIHIASALATSCDIFLTNDKRLKRVAELSVIILDELNRNSAS